MKFLLCVLLSVVCINCEEITSLPGLTGSVPFRHYSGYLDAAPTRKLHYWFVESQHSPTTDPVLLWMNGGPGCSSLDGLLNELGPFKVQDDGQTLQPNPYSWNLFANVIFLEAPAGVGFSYSTNGNVTTNDDQTSQDNYQALVQFFQKFPKFKKNDFYIGGESYGGVYVPTLASRVIEDKAKAKLNLKGVYIGNGFLNKDLNTDSMIHFAYSHGIMSEHDWDFMERTCCGGCSDFCKFHKATGGKCEHLVQGTIQFMWNGGLNPYDLYRDCAFAKNSTRHRVMMRGLAPRHVQLAYEREMRSFDASRTLMASGPPCMNDGPIEAYLNRADVRTALHIPASVPRWTVCSDAVGQVYQMQYTDMKDKLKEIIGAKKRVLIYNGDTDMACNFLLGTRFIMELGIEFEQTKVPFKHAKQIAGFWTKYEGLDFITIKGAGHMAPQWRPAATFHMMYRYVNKQPYN